MIRKLTVMLLIGAVCLSGVTSVWAAKYNEAPMLKVMVAAGELPLVEQRLPDEPLVVKPVEEIGQYGGTVYAAHTNPNALADGQWCLSCLENLLTVTPLGKRIVPNIAKSWEFSEENKVLTLYLRKGIKWSDGAPFTADDIMFWWQDTMLNKELTPRIPMVWRPAGEPMRVEKVDEYTVRLRFAVPYFYALSWLAYEYVPYLPKHYLKKFHPRYTEKEKLEDLVKKEGFEFWHQLFRAKNPTWGSPKVGPRLQAFIVKEKKIGETLLERNPYYWKIDPEGNQLPYIDRISMSLVANQEVINMKMISGEIDFMGTDATLGNYRLYKENAEKGNYRILLWTTNESTEVGFYPNQTHKDPVLRKIIQDRRFRYALSLAINREDINEAIFYGMGEPRQTTVQSWSASYEERFAKAYAEYNPEEANRLLDEMGLEWDKNHEYRLRPDGKRLTLTIEYWPYRSRTEICELVKDYWEAIGIGTALKPQERSFHSTRVQANEFDVSLWHIVTKTDYLCFNQWQYTGQGYVGAALWPAWYEWNLSKGKTGEEPPVKIKELFETYDRLQVATSKEEMLQLAKKILEFQAENINIIGTVGNVPKPIIAKNNLRNIPEEGLWAWDTLFIRVYHPEQFFLKEE